jgi:hypothetical protein
MVSATSPICDYIIQSHSSSRLSLVTLPGGFKACIEASAKQKRQAAGVRRQRSLRVVQRDEGLLPRIQVLKAEHPFRSYRRIWASLRFIEQWPVNKKRVLHLMREHQLLVLPHLRLNAQRTPTARKPKPMRSNEGRALT